MKKKKTNQKVKNLASKCITTKREFHTKFCSSVCSSVFRTLTTGRQTSYLIIINKPNLPRDCDNNLKFI